jgi:hypothetical protein
MLVADVDRHGHYKKKLSSVLDCRATQCAHTDGSQSLRGQSQISIKDCSKTEIVQARTRIAAMGTDVPPVSGEDIQKMVVEKAALSRGGSGALSG